MLNWRTVTSYRDSAFLTKGAELSVALVPGFRNRFQICEMRCLVPAPEGSQSRYDYDREYFIRDAERVSDADVADGKRPPIIGRFATVDEALAAIEPMRPHPNPALNP